MKKAQGRFGLGTQDRRARSMAGRCPKMQWREV
jgi:hypothetical protein